MFEKTKQSSETTRVLESMLMCEVKKYEMQTKNFYLPENMRLNSVQITETSQDYVVMTKNLKSPFVTSDPIKPDQNRFRDHLSYWNSIRVNEIINHFHSW